MVIKKKPATSYSEAKVRARVAMADLASGGGIDTSVADVDANTTRIMAEWSSRATTTTPTATTVATPTMNIGALPRRCRPQFIRIGTAVRLIPQSAIPWRFNRSQALSRLFRLPSTGLTKVLDHENMELLGYAFEML